MPLYSNIGVTVTGSNVYTALDSSTIPTNAQPRNPLGTLYSPPINLSGVTTASGYGAPSIYKYVQYNSTANPAVLAAPAVVYYTDETFTKVSAVSTESFGGAVANDDVNAVAGYLLINSTSYTGLTAAILNTNYVWIQVAGFLKGATVGGAGGIGSVVTGAAGNWNTTTTAPNTAFTGKPIGITTSAIAGGLADVLIGGFSTFWGS